jgi:hypothetical protein
MFANVVRFFDEKYRRRREKHAMPEPPAETNGDRAIYKNT